MKELFDEKTTRRIFANSVTFLADERYVRLADQLLFIYYLCLCVKNVFLYNDTYS